MRRYCTNDVIMCQGSNCLSRHKHLLHHRGTSRRLTNISDARTYRPRVARIERTMFLNIGFTKISLNWSGRPCTSAIFCMPLIASKKAAICATNLRTALVFFKKKQRDETHCHVNRNQRKPYKRRRIPPLTPLRPISKRQDEAHDEQTQVKVFQNNVDNLDTPDLERGILHALREDDKGNIIVSLATPLTSASNSEGGTETHKSKPRKDQIE
jgi:hypothetical protein